MIEHQDPYDLPPPARARSRPLLRALLMLALAFLAGLIVMAVMLRQSERVAAWFRPPPPVVATPRPPRIVAPAQPLERRVAAVEGRLAQVDARTRAVTGNADRAEGLLVAFAARRALDRGAELGYIEALLRERFGGGQPLAVAAILGAARQPVTLEALDRGLETASPTLLAASPDEHWWVAARRELAGLIVVRRGNAPSTAPADRLARARRHLDEGDVEAALAEVARMPGRDSAGGWIAQARRYIVARRALDTIETAALLAPRGPVAPVSPAAAGSGS